MNRPNRIPKLKIGLSILASLCFIFIASSCMMMGQRQAVEDTLFRQGEVIKYEFKTGDQLSERVLTDEDIRQLKEILRVEQRSWNRSFASYAPKIRIKSGKSDINITSKIMIINLVDPDGKSSQIVAECEEDVGEQLMKLLNK